MVEPMERLEERRAEAYLMLYRADFSYNRLESWSEKTWLDDRERSKARGWGWSQPLETWLAELPAAWDLVGRDRDTEITWLAELRTPRNLIG